MFASLWCVNIGYGRKEIAETLRDQALKMAYYHSHARPFERAESSG